MIRSFKSCRKAVACGVALLLVSCASFAYADAKDDVAAAADKSFAAKTYSWVGTWTDEPEVHAKTESDGLSSVIVTIDGKLQTAVLKDNLHSAALTDAGWKSLDDLSHDPKQEPLSLWMSNWHKRLPAHNVQQWIANAKDLSADAAGHYTGTYEPSEAIRTLGGKRKGISEAHGTLTITIKDGYITQAERHLTGTMTTSDGSKTVDRTESYSFSDYDAAKPDVPDAAKQALSK